MGTPGVPWEKDKQSIIEVLKARKGRVTYAAKDLGVAYTTLKKRIDSDEELIELVKDLRNEADTILTTLGEDVLYYAMSQMQNDLNNALKATFFVLNNKGKDLGYNRNNAIIDINADDREAQAVLSIDEKNRQRSSERSLLENQQSILDQECSGGETAIRVELGSEDIMGGNA